MVDRADDERLWVGIHRRHHPFEELRFKTKLVAEDKERCVG